MSRDLGEVGFLPALSATSVTSNAWVCSDLLTILHKIALKTTITTAMYKVLDDIDNNENNNKNNHTIPLHSRRSALS